VDEPNVVHRSLSCHESVSSNSVFISGRASGLSKQYSPEQVMDVVSIWLTRCLSSATLTITRCAIPYCMHWMENSILQYFFRNRPRIDARIGRLLPLFGILPPRASARVRSEQVDELHGSMEICDGVFLPLPCRPGIPPASHHRLLQATKPSTRMPGSIFERRCRTSRGSTERPN
jgi:hypothetical protein